jgi:hypothetical protein
VISGHVCYSAHREDIGDNGNTIYELLQDYQDEDSGGGYIRLLKIDSKKNTITAKIYSPYFNKEKMDSSAFSFSNVRFIKP